MSVITIYTDGAAKGNPGNGGYGVVMMSGHHKKELSEGFRLTTNNRMELLSVIVALETIKTTNAQVEIFSDSKYVVDSVEKKWVFGWQKKGFKGKKNIDLWQRFLKIYPKHQVKFNWVKGHAGNLYNERCDELAVQAAEGQNLLIDEGYEKESSEGLF
ncbi:ribonuclease HI [Vicingus serpentipes]|uniref:ribonuclease H n=1 Tax=Vicingus serpentipes TaxID=1926625 RepID=A0A5C6RQV3_9FLAO|nr:ribonuclease HI [Vicingus serpentipes]TXB64721.1 ribonuclease HI [Vicingus serpentipes]